MLGKNCQVWRQRDDGRFEKIDLDEVRRMGEQAVEKRRKAA